MDKRSQDSGKRQTQGGNPQSDRSYDRTPTGTHKSKLGGANRQTGSSRDAPKSDHSDSSQSSDSPSQSGETGTDEDAGTRKQSQGGSSRH
jgi:hypothetical protein